ncbi:hypothetical protein GF386_00165 [Candidatus Pacearchaeota archaeon]|nr:hypothetical protein [Candidatus Pacearchaeota archaeon]MBD3282696.1 hypothetical protein [Candidatus Pacearchaeota archaeon]
MKSKQKIPRRNFLKASAAGLAGILLGDVLGNENSARADVFYVWVNGRKVPVAVDGSGPDDMAGPPGRGARREAIRTIREEQAEETRHVRFPHGEILPVDPKYEQPYLSPGQKLLIRELEINGPKEGRTYVSFNTPPRDFPEPYVFLGEQGVEISAPAGKETGSVEFLRGNRYVDIQRGESLAIIAGAENSPPGKINVRKPNPKPFRLYDQGAIIETQGPFFAVLGDQFVNYGLDSRTGRLEFQIGEIPEDAGYEGKIPPDIRMKFGDHKGRVIQTSQGKVDYDIIREGYRIVEKHSPIITLQ